MFVITRDKAKWKPADYRLDRLAKLGEREEPRRGGGKGEFRLITVVAQPRSSQTRSRSLYSPLIGNIAQGGRHHRDMHKTACGARGARIRRRVREYAHPPHHVQATREKFRWTSSHSSFEFDGS